ncbi:TonB-dependent receptor [Massilibacteroides sp.]|uniref:SusC/RagA family TonB-linked outer membrane protein n=1 Tax=Massilibacteroides sp. TaxID=2034766 RepID=UPI0026033DB4|nr:TonB-dependent receptor [Massilibacteroides sp.]MDD4515831.1 TonB-dependent receptor [Massilibacteroides sp.]
MKKTLLIRMLLICSFVFYTFPLLAQDAASQNSLVISGTVTDEIGEPLPGVNVIQKDTHQGTITDLNGKYTITVPNKNVVLVFSYIGYIPQEFKANRSEINVKMGEDTETLDEIVVIGYGTAKKRDLTGAISNIKTEKLEVEAPRSVQDLLRANSPGLNITMATDAKGSADLQIRGKNTLKAGSSPLIVLDGVIFEGSLTDINPNDIQAVDVLKDASSAAVYGAKAANGVVMISTKKGKTGKPVVTFNSNIGVVQSANQPKLLSATGFIKYRQDYEVGKNSDEYLAKYPEMFTDPRQLSNVNQLDWYNYDQKTPVSSVTEEDLVRSWLSRLELKAPEIENYLNGRITDWADLVFQTGLQQDYTASISNRTDNMSYYWSIGYADREGIKTGNRYTNFRTRLNLESKVTDFLTIGVNSNFSSRDEGFLTCDWEQMVRISPYGSNNIDDPDSPYQRLPTGDVTPVNPFYDNQFRDRKDLYHTLNANMYAIVKLPFDIEYQVNFTPYYEWHEYYNHESSKNSEWANKGGSSERKNTKKFNWQVDNIIRWKKEFNKIHKFEVTLLANAEKGQYWETVAKTSNYSPSDVLGYHRLQAGAVPLVSSNDTYQTGDALMGRLFYSFKDKYMITTSVRRDGYSAFGQTNPRATFPSVALGWTFSSEKFMKPVESWLNYGKLRLSWGENGNRDIGQYDALSDMTSGLHPYIDQNGNLYISSQLYVNRMANKNLKWERTGSYNLGIDFSILNNKISGSMEGYIARTNDLLVDRALPDILGFNSVATNLGQLQNKGFELTLNANLIEKENFAWDASGNFSLNRRKIKKLYGDMVDVLDDSGNVIGQEEADDVKNKWFIGRDPDQIWDYERDGVWQVDEKEEAAKFGLQPGDFKYIDQNEDGVMTNDDKVFQGYTTPRFRWTLRNEFTFYKDFALSFMMYSYWGQYDSFNRAANSSNFPDRCTEYVQPHWMPDNPINDYARIGSKNIGTNYLEKSFVRLENVTFSYNVPKNLLKKLSVQNMRLSLSVRNVAVFAPHWDFWDPEKSEPTPRTYNISVNFSL